MLIKSCSIQSIVTANSINQSTIGTDASYLCSLSHVREEQWMELYDHICKSRNIRVRMKARRSKFLHTMAIHARDPWSRRTDAMTRQLQSANVMNKTVSTLYLLTVYLRGCFNNLSRNFAITLVPYWTRSQTSCRFINWTYLPMNMFTLPPSWEAHVWTVDSIASELHTLCRRFPPRFLLLYLLMLLLLIFQPFVRQHSVVHADEHNATIQFWRGRGLEISKIIRWNINKMSIFKRLK